MTTGTAILVDAFPLNGRGGKLKVPVRLDDPQSPTKKCSRCGDVRPRTEQYFHKCTRTPDGLQRYCKHCMSSVGVVQGRKVRQRIMEQRPIEQEKKNLADLQAEVERCLGRKLHRQEIGADSMRAVLRQFMQAKFIGKNEAGEEVFIYGSEAKEFRIQQRSKS